ncbi:MAG: tRNA (adenosine(37)-N6)-dimethylallyltransferase MiaA, partial [Bacteroidales bacterium]|nr:tRNA (adenosine(37)-N6)-dimethylallyltransferase MiaA [Bacteroidales bacterium]
TDVLKLLSQLFQKYNQVILCGGSGLYIDAVVKGIDDLPDPDTEIRAELKRLCAEEGIETLRAKLKIIDPEYYDVVDLANPIRLIRALEIYYVTGKKFSQLRSGTNKKRDFNIVKYALQLPREQLYERINSRVDLMMQAGLLDEVKSLIPYRHYPALNTVGYKELFSYLDGEISLDTAVEKIKTDTRRYAKRQITWISRDNGYKMIAPDASFVENVLSL